MRCVDPGTDFASWRDAARGLLEEGVPPGEVLWEAPGGLFSSHGSRGAAGVVADESAGGVFRAGAIGRLPPRAVAVGAALSDSCGAITRGGERHLLAIASDPDMAAARNLEKSVRREIHKMHAFVRFRLIDTDEETAASVTRRGSSRIIPSSRPARRFSKSASPTWTGAFSRRKAARTGMARSSHSPPAFRENPVEDPDALEDRVAHLLPQHLQSRAAQGEGDASGNAEALLEESAGGGSHRGAHRREQTTRRRDVGGGAAPGEAEAEERVSGQAAGAVCGGEVSKGSGRLVPTGMHGRDVHAP